MAYIAPSEFVTKMVDAGESKLLMSTRDTLIRSYMAGAILALAAAFAVTITVNTGNPLLGAVLFPVGFVMLYLLGFDLLTGVFTLVPLGLFITSIALPAWVMLIYWGALQLLGGFTSIGAEGGGVAFWAHVGGFSAGVVLVKLFARPADVAAHLNHDWHPPRGARGRGA